MRLFRIQIDVGRPTQQQVNVERCSDWLMAVRLSDGSDFNILCQDGTCPVYSDYQLEGYSVYHIKSDAGTRFSILKNNRELSFVTVNCTDATCYEVDWTEISSQPVPSGNIVRFGCDWSGECSIDGSENIEFIPGQEVEADNIGALVMELAPLNGGESFIAEMGYELSCDILAVQNLVPHKVSVHQNWHRLDSLIYKNRQPTPTTWFPGKTYLGYRFLTIDHEYEYKTSPDGDWNIVSANRELELSCDISVAWI